MTSLEPLINLLIVLTVLSVAAERVTTFFKLRNNDLRDSKTTKLSEKEREQQITFRSLMAGVFVAVAVKADLFEMLTHLDAPWDTLGWVKVSGAAWVRTPATAGLGTAIYAAVGSAITGLALGFGSKFWHEILDAVFELRGIAKKVRERAQAGAGARTGGGGHA